MYCLDCTKKRNCVKICPELKVHLDSLEKYQRERTYQEDMLALLTNKENITWQTLIPDSPWVWDDISVCLNCLPDNLRAPFLLYYYEGMRISDVAVTLGIHRTTVNRRLKKAVKSMRNEFKLKGITQCSN